MVFGMEEWNFSMVRLGFLYEMEEIKHLLQLLESFPACIWRPCSAAVFFILICCE